MPKILVVTFVVFISLTQQQSTTADWRVVTQDFNRYVFVLNWLPQYCYNNRFNNEIYKKCHMWHKKSNNSLIPGGLFVAKAEAKGGVASMTGFYRDCKSFMPSIMNDLVQEKVEQMYTVSPENPEDLWEHHGKCSHKDINEFFMSIWTMYRKFHLFEHELNKVEETEYGIIKIYPNELYLLFEPYSHSISFECTKEIKDDKIIYYLNKIVFSMDLQYNLVQSYYSFHSCGNDDPIIIRGMSHMNEWLSDPIIGTLD